MGKSTQQPSVSKELAVSKELVSLVEITSNEDEEEIITVQPTIPALTYQQALRSTAKESFWFLSGRIPIAVLKVADGFVVGRLPQEQVLAAPYAFTYFAMLMGITRGMCTATAPRVGRQFGKKDYEAAGRENVLAWLMAAELSLVGGVALYSGGGIGRLLGLSTDITQVVTGYGIAVVPGLIGIYGGTCDQSFFIATGQRKKVFVLGTLYSAFAMALGYPLALLNPSWGLTALGVGLSASGLLMMMGSRGVLLLPQYKQYQLYHPRFEHFWREMKAFLKEASAIGALRFLNYFNWAALVVMMYLTHDENALLALQVTLQPITFWNIFALSQANIIRIMIAKETGKMKGVLANAAIEDAYLSKKNAYQNMHRIGLWGTTFYATGAVAMSASMVFGSSLYARTFLSDDLINDEMLTYTQSFMLLNAIGILLATPLNMGIGMLGGQGDLVAPTIINFIALSAIGLTAGGIFTLLLDWGADWLFITQDAGIILAACAMALRTYQHFKAPVLEEVAHHAINDETINLLENNKKTKRLPDCSSFVDNAFSFFCAPCNGRKDKANTKPTVSLSQKL